jgi:hypothetical protein
VCEATARAALSGDQEAFGRSVPLLMREADAASAAELTSALPLLAQAISEARPHAGGWLAVLGCAWVEKGADPAHVGPAIVDRLNEVTAAALAFVEAWQAATATEPPDPARQEPSQGVWETVQPALGDGAGIAMESWWSLEKFAMASCTALATSPGLRASLTERDFRVSVAEKAAPFCGQLEYVRDLLRVLDDERLLVLDRASRRGWSVVVRGIGDNFQLHTLLAAALVGRVGGVPGEAPDPRWVSSSTDGDVPPGTPPVTGRWNLADAHGQWIWNEGVPADIPALNGTRVVVLDPPAYARSWSPGRRFPMMPGSLTVESTHDAAAMSSWWPHIAAAKPPAG